MSKRTNRLNSTDLTRTALLLLPLVAALTAAPSLQAQTASFAGVQTTVLGSGLRFPIGVATDGSGNVFIGDFNNNRVLKVSPTGTQTTVASDLKLPYGVAVDASGNVLIADAYNNRVVKVFRSGAQTTAVSGLNQPSGVAVDVAGNMFIADTE